MLLKHRTTIKPILQPLRLPERHVFFVSKPRGKDLANLDLSDLLLLSQPDPTALDIGLDLSELLWLP